MHPHSGAKPLLPSNDSSTAGSGHRLPFYELAVPEDAPHDRGGGRYTWHNKGGDSSRDCDSPSERELGAYDDAEVRNTEATPGQRRAEAARSTEATPGHKKSEVEWYQQARSMELTPTQRRPEAAQRHSDAGTTERDEPVPAQPARLLGSTTPASQVTADMDDLGPRTRLPRGSGSRPPSPPDPAAVDLRI